MFPPFFLLIKLFLQTRNHIVIAIHDAEKESLSFNAGAAVQYAVKSLEWGMNATNVSSSNHHVSPSGSSHSIFSCPL
jgi:hypothetical protein